MEALDRHFENVCELDLVFHFDEVSWPGPIPNSLAVSDGGCAGPSHSCRNHTRRPCLRDQW